MRSMILQEFLFQTIKYVDMDTTSVKYSFLYVYTTTAASI